MLLILPVVPSNPVDPSLPSIAADPAGTVAVATGAGDVDVAFLVGVADSPAHASATMSMSPARVAIIGLTLYPFRNIACHPLDRIADCVILDFRILLLVVNPVSFV